MATFDFPNSPTLDQLYEPAGGPKYRWDGAAWAKVAGSLIAEAPTDGSTYARRGSDATWQAINSIGGISTAEYTYSTTPGLPPSTGQLRANSSTQTAITAFYLHETNAVGVDITNALKIIVTGVKILVQDKTNSANVQYYTVTGPAVDNGVYFTIPVVWTATGSGTPFTPGRVIFAGFGIGSNNMAEAPTDGQIYGRRGSDASWQVASGTFVDAPSDNGEYVRVNGVWRLRAQTFNLAGLASQVVTVPTWGPKFVKLTGAVYCAAATQFAVRLSGDGSTFPAGASDYSFAGFANYGSTAALLQLPSASVSQAPLSSASDNPNLSLQCNATLSLTRETTGKVFTYNSNASGYNVAAGYTNFNSLIEGYQSAGATTSLTIKAFQIFSMPSLNVWTSGTLNVEWVA